MVLNSELFKYTYMHAYGVRITLLTLERIKVNLRCLYLADFRPIISKHFSDVYTLSITELYGTIKLCVFYLNLYPTI